MTEIINNRILATWHLVEDRLTFGPGPGQVVLMKREPAGGKCDDYLKYESKY